MSVVLTGGTGYIGSAVLRRLVARGHEVVAVVRSDAAAEAVRAAGAEPAAGELTDREWLGALLVDADAAIHLADLGPEGDDAVLDAVIAAFSGTDRPYLHTGGVWTWGAGDDIREDDPGDPPALTAWRLARHERVLSAPVAAAVISPGIVYGHGRGIPVGVIADARDSDGVVPLVGDGSQHWTTVHVDDLAELYVLALEQRAAGEFIGVSGVNPTVRELAEAVAGPDGTVRAETVDASRARLGEGFADALLLDQQARGAKAREVLGWEPRRPSLLEELRGRAVAAG
ncbi:NAD-dependent epimerase/dehydratase family protein [Protaetiibacter larvae]|uniref:NAD-dependent epimerase/dehydratase family protein n=1 Tax=Protaetiibacter larvae TaxID=2592654 RepID=A0A5C1YBJ8_9MICO|nr:NAD-dependent epimerase/dehydratase family protein [Protaetiibacter larvae]QEO10509.1 NAD-dependent epimerase/dehydratase family protein [Protaetiibacter larvae]